MSGAENKEPDVANDLPDDGIPSISFSVKLVGTKDPPKSFTFKRNETVADLKAKIALEDDKATPNDLFIYSGKNLENDSTFHSIKLKPNAVINCIRRENKPKPPSEPAAASSAQSSASTSNSTARTPISSVPPAGTSARPSAGARVGGIPFPLESMFGSSQLESILRDPGQMAAILQDPQFRELIASNPEIFQSIDRLRDVLLNPEALQAMLGSRGQAAGAAPMFSMPEQMGEIAQQIIQATGGRLSTPEQLMSLMQEISGRPNEMPSQEELSRFMQALREQQGTAGSMPQTGIPPTSELEQMNQLLQMGIRPDMFGGIGSDMDEVTLQQLLAAMIDGYGDEEFTADPLHAHASDGEDVPRTEAASGEGVGVAQAATGQAAPAREPYAAQVSQLQSMGFSDLQLIRRALQVTFGNVDEALNFLLDE